MNTTNDTRLCDPDYVPVDYFHDIIPKILNRIYDRYVSHIFVKCINIENDYYHWLDDLRLIFENFGYGKMLAVESNNPMAKLAIKKFALLRKLDRRSEDIITYGGFDIANYIDIMMSHIDEYCKIVGIEKTFCYNDVEKYCTLDNYYKSFMKYFKYLHLPKPDVILNKLEPFKKMNVIPKNLKNVLIRIRSEGYGRHQDCEYWYNYFQEQLAGNETMLNFFMRNDESTPK